MAQERTDRHALPLLQAGQAQKEMTHNEALVLLDALAMPAAIGIADVPPETPAAGDCWIVGSAPSGPWAEAAETLAMWTANGWRFIVPRDGMRVWLIGDACEAAWHGGGWTVGTVRGRRIVIDGQPVVGARQPAIGAPAGGGVVDVEARVAIAAITAALAGHGLIAAA